MYYNIYDYYDSILSFPLAEKFSRSGSFAFPLNNIKQAFFLLCCFFIINSRRRAHSSLFYIPPTIVSVSLALERMRNHETRLTFPFHGRANENQLFKWITIGGGKIKNFLLLALVAVYSLFTTHRWLVFRWKRMSADFSSSWRATTVKRMHKYITGKKCRRSGCGVERESTE